RRAYAFLLATTHGDWLMRWLAAHWRVQRRDLTEGLDDVPAAGQRIDQLAEIVQSLHRMGHQALRPAGILRLGHSQVPDRGFEVLAIAVDRADHDLVSEHELEVDLGCWDFDRLIAARHARQDEDAVLAQSFHR